MDKTTDNQSTVVRRYSPGTHLVVEMGTYDHHGLATGDGRVIHFGRGVFDIANAIVEEVSMQVFANGNEIRAADSLATFGPEEIVQRARTRIGERGYDLFDNNCEHFVNWCRSDRNESHQVNLTEAVARQSAAVMTRPVFRAWAVSQLSKRVTGRAVGAVTRCLARGPASAACLADVVQASAEIVATHQGKSKNEARRIGQSAGLTSSMAMGWVVGGPVTAAAGAGLWVGGQLIGSGVVATGKRLLQQTIRPCNRS